MPRRQAWRARPDGPLTRRTPTPGNGPRPPPPGEGWRTGAWSGFVRRGYLPWAGETGGAAGGVVTASKPSSSTSKTSTALPGMVGGRPCGP